jgi:TrmH family RNA methyltransferase
MSQIASQQNPRLKAVRRLHTKRERARTGTFLAEGEDLVAAARASGRPAIEGYRLAGSGLGGAEFHDVEQAALASVSTLGSGTRVIGIYKQAWSAPAGPLCIYLHGVGDPGNVGTVLRSALAFGAASVVFGPGCADPHGPKAVRASMGAIFAVRIARAAGPGELPGERVALAARLGEPLVGDAGGAVSLLIGAERDGLPQDVIDGCDRVAHIPIESESLNAAMAATVAMYEMTRASSRVRAS